MHVKSFGIVMLKGSVISENRAPFYIYNYNIKKRKYQEKITIIFVLFLKVTHIFSDQLKPSFSNFFMA